MRRLHVNGESEDFILFDKALANPNNIPVYMKVNYLFTLCLFKVGRHKQNINPTCACHVYLINSIILFYLFIFKLCI
jgi:hypothetical protein